MFERRIVELCKQQAQYEKKLPKTYFQARVFQADARKLPDVSAASVDLVVCSPPYPGVFDYLDHHALRISWLGLEGTSFERAEIGARRQMIKLGEGAYQRWRGDFKRVLEALKRVGKPETSVAMVIADSVVGDRAVFADDLGQELARELGLRVRAICSQRRPYFHQKTLKAFGRRPRKEHLLVLQLPASDAKRA
jgi:DNA modification methylase